MPRVSLEVVRDLAGRLDGVPAAARAAIKREFLATYGCSPSTLSRALHEIGVRSHTRADAGTRRKEVTEEILQRIAAIQRASLSLRKGVVMPAEDAINIAEDSGWIDKGALSPSYFNRWLRDQDASRRDQIKPEPHIELRSLGPNHVHQVDFSLAVNWKVFQGKPQYEHLIYKNKLPGAGVPRLYRLIVVDHATGCFFPHYTESTGETVQALLEGLYRSWAPKQLRGESIERLYPFRGVPRILMADRGSANQAGVTATLMERLGVQLNICEGARSKGAVEVSHGVWEQHFESRMRLQQPESVEQLNEWAVDFTIRQCACKPHTRHGAPRSQMWAWHINRRPETQLRELRCDWEGFKSIALTDPTTCRVSGNRIVRFKARKYRVPDEFLPNETVLVQYSPFYFPQILVRAADVAGAPGFLCEPVEVDEFGFAVTAPVIGQEYKSWKQTDTARFVNTTEEITKELIASQNLRVYGHHRQGVEPIPIRHSGADVLEAAAAPVLMSKIQARQTVRENVGRDLVPAEWAFVNSLFGDQVSETEVANAVAQILAGVQARVLHFKEAAL